MAYVIYISAVGKVSLTLDAVLASIVALIYFSTKLPECCADINITQTYCKFARVLNASQTDARWE